MNRMLWGLLLGVLFPAGTTAAEPVYRWARPVALPNLITTTPLRIPLDETIHAATRADWPDLRLKDQAGGNVAFVLRMVEQTKPEERTVTFPPESLTGRRDPERGFVVEVSRKPDDPIPDALRIGTPLVDFELQVTVEGSRDGSLWESLGGPGLIFDYQRYLAVRQLTVPMKRGPYRHYRLHVTDVTAEQESRLLELTKRLADGREVERTERLTIDRRPFKIDTVTFARTDVIAKATEPERRTYPVKDFQVTEDPETRSTVLTCDIDRQPIDRIKLLTTSRNFSRVCRVEVIEADATGKEHFRDAGTTTLTRFSLGDLERDDVICDVRLAAVSAVDGSREDRPSRLRIRIENRDSGPLDITGIEAYGPEYELVCLAEPGQSLRLEYGSDDAAAGDYDTAALRQAMRQTTTWEVATLGPAMVLSDSPSAKPWTPWWNDPLALTVGLLLLAALLGYGLMQAGKRVQELPPSEPE